MIDPQSNNIAQQYQFLNLRVFRINTQQEIQSYTNTAENTISIPFVLSLAPHLSGTYKDKKGFVHYCLQRLVVSLKIDKRAMVLTDFTVI